MPNQSLHGSGPQCLFCFSSLFRPPRDLDVRPMTTRSNTPLDLNRSLEDISGTSWGKVLESDNGIVTQRKKIRLKPIGQLTSDDLNVLAGIGQDNVFVVNFTMRYLKSDPIPMSLLIRIMKFSDYKWQSDVDGLDLLRNAIDRWEADWRENNEDIDCARQCGLLFHDYAYFERGLNNSGLTSRYTGECHK